jgi:NADH-quinone oxidoreductase subunit B
MEEGTGSEAARVLSAERARVSGTNGAEARRLDLRATRLEKALDWAAGLAPSPLRVATSCCGMSMMHGGDPYELLGSGPPAVSSRAADLLIVAGTVSRRQAPLLLEIYERMLEPRWVIAWGACAISGGAYDNYATISGLGSILPVDLVVPGCPPAPVALREALEMLRSGAVRRGSTSSSPREDWPIQRPK